MLYCPQGAQFLVGWKADFHIHRIEFETKMCDDGTVGVFLRSFKKTDRVKDLVELFRVRGDVGSGGKDREEVKIMCI
jgi:hypothetical protein